MNTQLGNETILNALCELYRQHEIDFRQVTHQPTMTSEESALVRGEPLEIGGKALLLKIAKQFHLFVLPAHRQIDSAKIKSRFETKKLRFATREELAELTGLVPGSVPPFGEPILPFQLFMDQSFQANDRIAFNAGMLTVSHVLELDNYVRVANPQFFSFAKNPDD